MSLIILPNLTLMHFVHSNIVAVPVQWLVSWNRGSAMKAEWSVEKWVQWEMELADIIHLIVGRVMEWTCFWEATYNNIVYYKCERYLLVNNHMCKYQNDILQSYMCRIFFSNCSCSMASDVQCPFMARSTPHMILTHYHGNYLLYSFQIQNFYA